MMGGLQIPCLEHPHHCGGLLHRICPFAYFFFVRIKMNDYSNLKSITVPLDNRSNKLGGKQAAALATRISCRLVSDNQGL